MLIAEIVDLQDITNANKGDAIEQQAKQVRVKKAKLTADKAQQRVAAAQQRLRKTQTT
jgi:hypothetical protein